MKNGNKNRNILHKTLILMILVHLFYSCSKDKYPEIGSIYIIQNQDNTFTTFKITDSNKKEISYIKNDYDVSQSSYIDSIISMKNIYTDAPKKMSITKFNALQKTKYIINENP